MGAIRYTREITAPSGGRDRLSFQTRLAAVLFLVPAAGFGLSTPFVLGHLAREGDLPTIIGIRALSGPFERHVGRDAFTALGWVLVTSCALDAVTGLWLWQGQRRRRCWDSDLPPSHWRSASALHYPRCCWRCPYGSP